MKALANRKKNKVNQPPSRQGKKQSTQRGEPLKISKRTEVLQAADAEQNIERQRKGPKDCPAPEFQEGESRAPGDLF